MAFDKNSNSFTFIFAIVLVVIVGALLAMTYIGLKPAYEENVLREKMQNILASMNVKVSRDEAPAKYKELITETVVVNAEGKTVEGDAFSVDVLKQYKDWKAGVLAPDKMVYPVYKAAGSEGQVFILPMVGTGLWGPVWGYVSVKNDGRTVYGSNFDHKGETPGLGAEISTPIFQDQFPGKTITDDNGTYTGIKVYKGGTGTTDPHGVDGISGGTITGDGVAEMLMRTLAIYDVYLKSNTNSTAAR